MSRPHYSKWKYLPEPMIFLYVTAMILHSPILQQYGHHRYSEKYNLNYSATASKYCHNDTAEHSNATKALRQKVQDLTAEFQIGFALFEMIPSVITCLYYGSWSDRIGRRPILIIALASSVVECISVLLTMGFSLPLRTIYIGSFLNGVGGYFTSLTMAVVAYIADITTREDRTLRLGILGGLVLVAGVVGSSFSGVLINSIGFLGAYSFVCCSMTLGLLYAIFILPESLDESNVSMADVSCFKYPLESFRVFFKRRRGRWRIFIITTAELFMYIINMSLVSVVTLYSLDSPFCLTPIMVGLLLGCRYMVTGCGVIIGLKLFGLCLRRHWIAIVSVISAYGMLVAFAFASKPYMLFIAWCAGIFTGVAEPVYRGILSNSISQKDQGKFFAVVSSLEILVVFIGNVTLNKLYIFGNHRGFPQLVFYAAMLSLCVPLVCTMVYCLSVSTMVSEKSIGESKALIQDYDES